MNRCDICKLSTAALFVVVKQDEITSKAHACVGCFAILQQKSDGEYSGMTVEAVSQQEFNELIEKHALIP